MALAAGARLGPYEIQSGLGAGGMGEVYRARDTRLGRDVAIKVLPQTVAADPSRLRRFEQEARAIAALSHPNVITIFDVAIGEPAYLVTELLEGETLRALLNRGPLLWSRTIEIVLQLLDGLAAAHARGILHRDLKPDNVFLTRDHVVKILDFGLAKLVVPASADDVTRADATTPGVLLGTVAYMAPEHLRGGAADARSDVFAVGAMLFELLTGERAFRGGSQAETLSAVLRERPQLPHHIGAGSSRSLARIIDRCLAKDPDDRFQSARELHFALELIRDVPSTTPVEQEPAGEKSVAVLPFANMNSDPESQYFSDGLSEELINALARLPGLRVAARTSTFRFRGREVDIREIGRQLNVATVLEGSVRRAGTRLRITAQLLNVADGYHLWSERYDRELADVFAIQDDITASIVRTLEPTLLGRHQSVGDRHSLNVEAFEQYLKGQQLWYQWTPQSLRAAVAAFEAAIRLDGNYALAQAGLVASYTLMHYYGFAPVHETKAKAESAVARAMAHGPSLAESRFAMALYAQHFTEAWETAEPHFQSAIELQPRGAIWQVHYGLFLAARHRFDEAQARVREALTLDPLSPLVYGLAARAMYVARRYNEAIQLGERALELHPDFANGLMTLGLVHSRLGHHDRAISLFEKIVSLSGRAPVFVTALGLALAVAGKTSDARALLDELRTRSAHEYVPPNLLCLIHFGLGDRDNFYADLLTVTQQGLVNGFGLELAVGPYLDDLAGEPRFTELFRRNHLAPRVTQRSSGAGVRDTG